MACLRFPRSKQEHTNPRLSGISGVDTPECPDGLALSLPIKASILYCPNKAHHTPIHWVRGCPSDAEPFSEFYWVPNLVGAAFQKMEGSLRASPFLKSSFRCSHFGQRRWLRLKNILVSGPPTHSPRTPPPHTHICTKALSPLL